MLVRIQPTNSVCADWRRLTIKTSRFYIFERHPHKLTGLERTGPLLLGDSR